MASVPRPAPAPAAPVGWGLHAMRVKPDISAVTAPRVLATLPAPAAATEFAATGSRAWEIAPAWGIGPAPTALVAPLVMTPAMVDAPPREYPALSLVVTTVSAPLPPRAPVTWGGLAPSATPANRAILVHPARRARAVPRPPAAERAPVTPTAAPARARWAGLATPAKTPASVVSVSKMVNVWTLTSAY